jgi:predicted CXXCH cytochrome family protein
MAGGNLIYLILLFFINSGNSAFPVHKDIRTDDCLNCHKGLLENNVVHPELASTCDICHTATGEEHPKSGIKGFNLTEKLPDLCFNCHSEFREKTEKYPVVHGPMTDTVSCLNCHNPHSSPQQRLLLGVQKDVCLKCHNRTIKKDNSSIRNIKMVLSKAKSIHEPVASGDCVSCHNPHFSEKRELLNGNFPSGNYIKATTDSFELCFMCHNSDLFEARNTESGTNFRNGDLNLHFVHSNGDKGRNCTMCHDVHGAVNDRLISDKLIFGSWESKIEYAATENGGSCIAACHSERKYDRTISR